VAADVDDVGEDPRTAGQSGGPIGEEAGAPAEEPGVGTWVPGVAWPAAVLPYGVVEHGGQVVPATAIGDHALDLAGLASTGLLDGTIDDPIRLFAGRTLDPLLAAGRPSWRTLRTRLAELVTDRAAEGRVRPHLLPLDAVRPRLAWTVADYVDFYSSLDHATNVGRIFRPGEDPLPAAWRYLPIGYHGRAGTVVTSGTDVVRPSGLRREGDAVAFGPSRQLDLEVEVGFVVGSGTTPGDRVTPDAFTEHVLGLVLVNDWSARDIQAFEYRPLGPFLGKSFATSVSPWIVPLDALVSARVLPPAQHPAPAAHLAPAGDAYDLDLELALAGRVVSRPRFAGTYWTPAQQLAHLTSNGATLRPGDLYASGTVSGPSADERGCLLELTWGGRDEVDLGGGERRTWLEDGDTVTIRGSAPASGGGRIPLGEVVGTVRPARP
jgi:fumarylacetoacetase